MRGVSLRLLRPTGWILPYESHRRHGLRQEGVQVGGTAMIRASVLRALVLTAAMAAALAPVTCLAETSTEKSAERKSPQVAGQGDKGMPAELLSLLRQKKMAKNSPILVRIFKEEAELEVWKQDATGRFQLLKTYPICRWSGDLGPKLYEGDRQAPEGFYTITPGLMNPHSSFYLVHQHRLPQQLRQGEQPRRQLADDPRRLLVERLLCHDRRTDRRDLFAGARTRSSAGRHSRSRPIRSA